MSAYVKCSGCGEIVEIPPELQGDMPDGDITAALDEPYYCDACDEETPSHELPDYYPYEEFLQ